MGASPAKAGRHNHRHEDPPFDDASEGVHDRDAIDALARSMGGHNYYREGNGYGVQEAAIGKLSAAEQAKAVAGLIASELGLELYQVDLSQVVSKWIGETEKQLARVFDDAEQGHALLLFDEADALFGVLSDVAPG